MEYMRGMHGKLHFVIPFEVIMLKWVSMFLENSFNTKKRMVSSW